MKNIPDIPSVVVLMSTYNGERYVREQVKSILGQNYPDFRLIVRDDGSLDRTAVILEEIAKADRRVTFIRDGENLGYPACFYRLTDTAPAADYYFFSDQDDVWLPDKIGRAVSCMKKTEEKKGVGEAVAYYGSYTVCDDNLAPIKKSAPVRKKLHLKDAVFEVCGLEFTMGINRAALELLNRNKPIKANARGRWMSMLFTAFGTVITDPKPYALYRRHSDTFTSNSQSGLGFWLWRIKSFFFGEFEEYHYMIKEFYRMFGKRLSEEEREMLYLFSRDEYFPNVFRKVFYPKRLRRCLLMRSHFVLCF